MTQIRLNGTILTKGKATSGLGIGKKDRGYAKVESNPP